MKDEVRGPLMFDAQADLHIHHRTILGHEDCGPGDGIVLDQHGRVV